MATLMYRPTLAQLMTCCLMWHQAITWTNVDISAVKSCGIHLRTISQEMLKISTLDMGLEITNCRYSHIPQGQWINTYIDMTFWPGDWCLGKRFSRRKIIAKIVGSKWMDVKWRQLSWVHIYRISTICMEKFKVKVKVKYWLFVFKH